MSVLSFPFHPFHVLESRKNKLVLLWENSDKHIANSLRRVMHTEVPTMAIHIAQVFENTSVMTDEMIVHRLGLVPLHSETVDNYLLAKECPCRSRQCENCSVLIDLHFTCFDDFANVTSRDLMSSNSNVVPVHDSTLPEDMCDGTESILLAKLKRNQQLHIKCVARKGIGLAHAKWSPAVAIVQRLCPTQGVDHDLIEHIEDIKTKGGSICCHQLKFNPINGELTVVQESQSDDEGVKLCQKCIEKPSIVNFEKSVSLFVIETNGTLPPRTVILQSILVLKKRVYTLLRELDNMNTSNE